MWNDLLIVAGQVLTLFLMMAAGFFFAKRGQLTTDGLSQMSHLLLYVVAPCIVIDSLLNAQRTPELTISILHCLLALLVSYGLYILLASFLFRRNTPPDTGAAIRFAMVYGNTGFMGLPLVEGILGEEALIYCTISLVVFNILTWTHGAAVMGGKEQISLKKALLNPGVFGCVAGFFFFFSGISLPTPVAAAVGYMGSLNTPLAMVVIGGQMAAVNLSETFRQANLYLACVVKLLVFPLLSVPLLLPLGLNELSYPTLVILSACPCAGITSIFAQNFHRDTAASAKIITLSTLLSILSLPFMALLARFVAGQFLA